MDLLAAIRALFDAATVTVPHDLGTCEATVVALDCRNRHQPALIAVTDAGHEVALPVDALAVQGSAR